MPRGRPRITEVVEEISTPPTHRKAAHTSVASYIHGITAMQKTVGAYIPKFAQKRDKFMEDIKEQAKENKEAVAKIEKGIKQIQAGFKEKQAGFKEKQKEFAAYTHKFYHG